jgi:hypothetical protein
LQSRNQANQNTNKDKAPFSWLAALSLRALPGRNKEMSNETDLKETIKQKAEMGIDGQGSNQSPNEVDGGSVDKEKKEVDKPVDDISKDAISPSMVDWIELHAARRRLVRGCFETDETRERYYRDAIVFEPNPYDLDNWEAHPIVIPDNGTMKVIRVHADALDAFWQDGDYHRLRKADELDGECCGCSYTLPLRDFVQTYLRLHPSYWHGGLDD